MKENNKPCKLCGNAFKSHSGKASFCSSKCKNEWGRKYASWLKEKKCLICNKTFKSKSKVCSRECGTILRWSKYYKEKPIILKICSYCKKQHNKKGKFCSKKCAIDSKKNRIKLICEVCNKEFLVKQSVAKRGRRFCSDKCQFAAQSNGLVKMHCSGIIGYRKDLPKVKFRSSLEADFARYLNYENISWFYEHKTFIVNENRHYTPDFYLNELDLFIELKGIKPDNELGKKLSFNIENAKQSLEDHGVNIITIYQKDFHNWIKNEGLKFVIKNLEFVNRKLIPKLVYN